MSVVAILLMFLAVMAMVKKIDQDRPRHPRAGGVGQTQTANSEATYEIED